MVSIVSPSPYGHVITCSDDQMNRYQTACCSHGSCGQILPSSSRILPLGCQKSTRRSPHLNTPSRLKESQDKDTSDHRGGRYGKNWYALYQVGSSRNGVSVVGILQREAETEARTVPGGAVANTLIDDATKIDEISCRGKRRRD